MRDKILRSQLSEFLKSRRARLSPEEVGLPTTNRRRSKGLRREDVAALAGLSSAWYTSLEQGRDVNPSNRVLEDLCRTLRLSEDERVYLFSLARNQPPPPVAANEQPISPAVMRTLEAAAMPALVMNRRWDLLAWNWLAHDILFNSTTGKPGELNLARQLFTAPMDGFESADLEAMARRSVAKLRVDYSQAGKDPAFDELIQELRSRSTIFAELWDDEVEILGRMEAIHPHPHPRYGALMFEHTSYVIEGAPALRVLMFAPYDDKTRGLIARIQRPVAA